MNKQIIALITSVCCFYILPLQGQIEQVIVESYYISDSNDETDTLANPFEGIVLAEGSRTYRIFVDLESDSKLKRIFSNQNHDIQLNCSGTIFNHRDRGDSFGYRVNDNKLDENTLGLDTWLTIGYASDAHFGIPKDLDMDGSIIGGVNNDGGSEQISEGLLNNNNSEAGIPITEADGLISTDSIPNDLSSFAIDDAFIDSTIFQLEIGNSFLSNEAFLQSENGIQGPTDDNIILIAQITTEGELNSFELNIEVEIINDFGETESVQYVASDSTFTANEFYSPWLSYPFVGGCTDPNFLEYNPAAVIDDGSCQTEIVLGCTDAQACNFDPLANFNIQEFCCYENDPESCYTDISLICNVSSVVELNDQNFLRVFPNPFRDHINLELDTRSILDFNNASIEILDMQGRKIKSFDASSSNFYSSRLSLSDLECGQYILFITDGKHFLRKRIMKSE